jgi:nucleoside-diphosphate-sugar epimerase
MQGRRHRPGDTLRKALITGGAGFIGYHLASHLVASGWRVNLVDSFARGASDHALGGLQASERVRLLERDLRSSDALADADDDCTHVFHLAAIVGVSHVLDRPYEVLRDNVAMLTHALDFARTQSRLERFLFASTSEVYAGTFRHLSVPIPTPEDVPLALPDISEPRTCYLLSKIYGEAMCQHGGIPFTIVRPHNVYGPRMGLSHVIPELLERAHAAADGGALEVFSVDHRRTFCHVDDAVAIIARSALTEKAEGEILNVGNEDGEVSIGELARVVLAVVGKQLEIVAGPETPGSPRRRCPDMTKTTRLTGYRPSVDLDAGIMQTYEWYRGNVFDGARLAVR